MRSYDDLVSEGRDAVRQKEDAKWRLGDLALEVDTGYGEQSLERWADDVGVAYATAREYRKVSRAFENDARASDVPWSVYRENIDLADDPGKFEAVIHKAMRAHPQDRVTVDGVRHARGMQPTRHAPPPRTTQEKIETARELLADEDVATGVMSDTATRVAITRASDDARSDQAERSAQFGRDSFDAEQTVKLIDHLLGAQREITRFLRAAQSSNITAQQRAECLDWVEDIENSVGWARSWLESSDTSWDDALAQMTGGR